MKYLPLPKPTKADTEFLAFLKFAMDYMGLEMNKAQREVARYLFEAAQRAVARHLFENRQAGGHNYHSAQKP